MTSTDEHTTSATLLTKPRLWLKSPLAVFTANNEDASNGLVVCDDRIVELVPAGKHPKSPVDQTLELKESIILPGLINCHHHFYQTLTRALPIALNKSLFPWLQSLYPIWAKLTPDMLSNATQVACLELMLSGTTTVADHHYLFPAALTDAIDIQVAALESLGCRAQLSRGSMSLGESSGGLPPDSVTQSDDIILKDCERVVNLYHQRGEGAMIQISLAPCSPFSVSKSLMKETAYLAENLDVLTHTHLAETEDENRFCLQTFNCRPLDYLESCGWLNQRTWLAHGIHFDAKEISRLGAAKIGVAHCPSSNMLLASGICPTLSLESQGCRLGIAVDGSASNDCSNMIQEVRQALLLQRLHYGAEAITAEKVLTWATKGAASIFKREDIGEIAVGKQADLAVFNLDELRFAGTGDPIAALINCGAHRVERLMVGGRWVIESSDHLDYLNEKLIHRQKTFSQQLQQLF